MPVIFLGFDLVGRVLKEKFAVGRARDVFKNFHREFFKKLIETANFELFSNILVHFYVACIRVAVEAQNVIKIYYGTVGGISELLE